MSRPADRITKEDLEQRFRALAASVDERKDAAVDQVRSAKIALAVLAVLLVFLLGRRSGKRRSTVVEVRRF
jgi:hypothetical protein